jgi:hypothetical protein
MDNDLDYSQLRTVSLLVDQSGGVFTHGMVRNWIFNRKENGFSDCLVRVCGRWFIDTERLNRWLASARERA